MKFRKSNVMSNIISGIHAIKIRGIFMQRIVFGLNEPSILHSTKKLRVT